MSPGLPVLIVLSIDNSESGSPGSLTSVEMETSICSSVDGVGLTSTPSEPRCKSNWIVSTYYVDKSVIDYISHVNNKYTVTLQWNIL